MDCAAVKPKMEALVRGTLPDAEKVLAEQHIASCEGCRLELELVRAIGSQEKPAAVGQADWTLDRIFGAEHQEGGPSQAAPALGSQSSPSRQGGSAPTADLFGEDPSAGETMGKVQGPGADAAPDAPSADGDPTSAGPSSWAFEPADAKADRKPPEESLFFAEEALARRRAGSKKGSNLRVVLWGTGGVVGAILLAISSWVVLHMAPSDADRPPAPSETNADSSAAAPSETPMEQDPEQPLVPEPAPSTIQEAPAPSAPAPGTVSSDRTGVGASAAARQAREQRTSASSVPQTLPLPGPGIAASRSPAPATTKHAPAPPPRQAAGVQQPIPRVAEPAKSSAPPSASTSGPSGESEEPNAGPAEDSPPEPDAPAENPSRASESAGPAGRRVPATSWLAPGSSDSAPYRSSTPPRNSAPPPSKAPEQSEPAPPKPATPIDRLHQATVAADEEEDVVALRRLRATWKTFMSKMGVGPDRARARREYADCLWAIQRFTGKRSDQRDALAAYREYLLSAPAGGADSRSVSRLRQLEDAISERR